jgi:hypothetical protein
MKQITLLFLLICATSFGQVLNIEFKSHTKEVAKTCPTQEKYTNKKLEGLGIDSKKPIITITQEQKEKFTELFNTQFTEFTAAYNNYKETESTAAKLEMIKLLVKQEEDFRALLTEKQKIDYSQHDNSGWNATYAFDCFFMSDKDLLRWKKELL